MATVGVQLKLPREMLVLDETVIASPKDQLRAFTMAADLGQLDDKQAAAAAGMDPSTWSQFKAGDRGIKPLEFDNFLDQCGNDLPLAAWAWRRGYVLTPRESELERRLRIEHEARAKAEDENRLLRGLLAGRAT